MAEEKPAAPARHRVARMGWISRAIRPVKAGARRVPRPPKLPATGREFSRLTVLPAVLVVAWLLPAVPLLLAGAFSLAPMLVISIPLAAAIIVIGLRRMPGQWPASAQSGTGPGIRAPWWPLLATVAVAAGFAAWQFAVNSEALIVTRDPGVYLQFGYWIGRHGTASVPVSAAAFGGPHSGLAFGSLGFIQRGTSLSPQYLAGLPAVLAAGSWAGGMPGALLVPPVLGALAILSFGGLVGRLVGPRWAPIGALGLALTLPEQYASRSALSETLVQILLFGGLCLVIDSLSSPGKRPAGLAQPTAEPAAEAAPEAWPEAVTQALPEPSGQPDPPALGPGRPRRLSLLSRLGLGRGRRGARRRVARPPRSGPGGPAVLAALGGLAFGLAATVRVDALSDLLPAIPFMGVLFAARKPQWLPLGAGLAVGVGYGLADGYLLARPYMDSLASSTRPLGIIAAGVALVTVDLALLARLAAPRRLTRRVLAAPPLRWLPGAVAILTGLVVIGFALRPYVQTVRGTSPSTAAYVGYLQRLAGLPLDPRRLYAEDTLYWVVWYVGVPAVLLGAFGLAILGRRVTRALITGKDPGGSARIWGLPLLIIIWVTVTVLWRPDVVPDQPAASRRLVPVVLPGLILAALWAAAWLTAQARRRGAGRLASSSVATLCTGALLLPTAATTFGVGVTSTGPVKAKSGGLALRQAGRGEITAVRHLCEAIGPGASVVIVSQRVASQFTQVIRGQCDTPAAVMTRPSVFAVQEVIAGIIRARRHPVLLAASQAALAGYGTVPRQVLNLTTTQDEHVLTRPPDTVWPIRYVIWMAQPG